MATHASGKPAGRTFRVTPKMIVAGVLILLAVWFVLVNYDNARITLWVLSVDMPKWLALGAMFAFGLVAGYLLAFRRKP